MKKTNKVLITLSSTAVLLWVILANMPAIISYTEVPSSPEKEIDNATLLVLAYPEAICRTTEAGYSDLLPLVGIGKKQMIRAGHACLVVAKEGCEKLEYFDNGRYIAPEGFCRVRGENTDPELKVDVKACWDGKKLVNVEEILAWLHAHPEKTHGAGTLYAGISETANYEAAIECINTIQDQNIIEYGPFAEGATNCARFVTDAIYNGIVDKDLKNQVRDLYRFTPSGLSNIEAANSYDWYYVADDEGVRKSDDNLSLIQLKCLFDGGKGYEDYSTSGTLCPPEGVEGGKDWKWLGGLGYGAWYDIELTGEEDIFKVSCYNVRAELNYSALYRSSEHLSKISDNAITYPSNFELVTLDMEGRNIVLEKISNLYPDTI